MTCFQPMAAYQDYEKLSENGKHPIYFTRSMSKTIRNIDIACGQCIGCRMRYSLDYGTRSYLEYLKYGFGSFITLTYDDAHLDSAGLIYNDFRKFKKRLKYHFGSTLNYVGCGEYGVLNGRPHFHLNLLGATFADRSFLKNVGGNQYYSSDILTDCWDNRGFAIFSDVSLKTLQYTSGYIMKAKKGKSRFDYVDKLTGELFAPPKILVSNYLGLDFFNLYRTKYLTDCYIEINNQKRPIPRYYERYTEKNFPAEFDLYDAEKASYYSKFEKLTTYSKHAKYLIAKKNEELRSVFYEL